MYRFRMRACSQPIPTNPTLLQKAEIFQRQYLQYPLLTSQLSIGPYAVLS